MKLLIKIFHNFFLRCILFFIAKVVEQDVKKVSLETETISCDGGQDGLGHPAVYYSFDQSNKIVCSYCGLTFIRDDKIVNNDMGS